MTKANSSKKRSSDENDFDILRPYILACPLVANPSQNLAVKAALAGLDQELKRRERDAKLQKKFSKGSVVSSAAKPRKAHGSETHTAIKQDVDDEWQAVQSAVNQSRREDSPEGDELEFIDMDGDTSFLGKKLAEVAIASVAESHCLCRSPLGAIAAALHSAMRSSVVGFTCTGSAHDKDQEKKSGFATPIRELTKTQFLPKDWDRYAASHSDGAQQQIVLRYRKNGTGSVLLRLETTEQPSASSSGKEVSVKLLPANTKEPPSQSLVFNLEDHVNLASWTAALRASNNSSGLEPALHYLHLPVLMTAFAKTFDLGNINDEKQGADSPTTAFIGVHSTEALNRNQNFAKPIYVGNGDPCGYDRPTIDNSFPQRPMFVDDFSGDLVPGGLPLDPMRRNGSDITGNVMGPNHPMFRGGGFGMRPRFDPFGPSGVQPPLGPGGRLLPPHRRPPASGEPNPDHLPPNSLGNNMFT